MCSRTSALADVRQFIIFVYLIGFHQLGMPCVLTQTHKCLLEVHFPAEMSSLGQKFYVSVVIPPIKSNQSLDFLSPMTTASPISAEIWNVRAGQNDFSHFTFNRTYFMYVPFT